MGTLLLLLHIAAGFIALATGLAAMLYDKTSLAHRKTGLWYYYAMCVIFLTGAPLAWMHTNWFLLSISFFAFYLSFTGYRFARRKHRSYQWLDKGIAGLFLLISLSMLGYSLYLYQKGQVDAAIILVVFGSIFLTSSGRDSLVFWGWRRESQHWVRGHIGRMGGSYIAALTAFLVNVIDFLPPVVSWLAPTAIGTILITRSIRHYRQKWQLDQ